MSTVWLTRGLVGALTLSMVAALCATPAEAQFLKKLKRVAEQKTAETVTGKAASAAGVETTTTSSGGYTRVEITDQTIADLITAVTPMAKEVAERPSAARLERERRAKADSYNSCKAKVMTDPSNLTSVDDATMDKYSAESKRLSDLMIKAAEQQKVDRQLAYADSLQLVNEALQLKQYPKLGSCGTAPPPDWRNPPAGDSGDGNDIAADVPSDIKSEYSRYAMGQLRERVAMWVLNDGKTQGAPGGGNAPYTDAELAVLSKHKQQLASLKSYLTDERVDWRSWRDLPQW